METQIHNLEVAIIKFQEKLTGNLLEDSQTQEEIHKIKRRISEFKSDNLPEKPND